MGSEPRQFAMIPGEAVHLLGDLLAAKVYIALAAKTNGNDRYAWITQQTLAEWFGVTRQAIGKAMQRLERVGLISKDGRVVTDHTTGRWVTRYLVPLYLHVATPGVATGSAKEVPDATGEVPDATLEGPDVTGQARNRAHSYPVVQTPHSYPLKSDFENDRRRAKPKTKSASKEELLKIKGIGKVKFETKPNLCRIPGCGKYNAGLSYCKHHSKAEIEAEMEKAIAKIGEEDS